MMYLIPLLDRYRNFPVWSDYIVSFRSTTKINISSFFFVWPQGWFRFLWIGIPVALLFDLRMPFLCLVTFWKVFVDSFYVEPCPGIIISCLNGVGLFLFSRESCGRMIIFDCLLGGCQFKYIRYGFFGRWTLNQQCIGVDILDIFLLRNAP